MFTRLFFIDLMERSLKTFAQVFLAAVGADVFNLVNLGWEEILTLALGSFTISILTSILSSKIGDDSASVVSFDPDAEG